KAGEQSPIPETHLDGSRIGLPVCAVEVSVEYRSRLDSALGCLNVFGIWLVTSVCAIGGADPLVCSRPPGRLFAPVRYRGQHAKADEGVGRGPGVRPTVRAEHSFPAEDL